MYLFRQRGRIQWTTALLMIVLSILLVCITLLFIFGVSRYFHGDKVAILNDNIEKTIGIDNETLLALLALLLAFAGALSWAFKKIIQRDIEDETERRIEAERNLSRSETAITLAYMNMRFYREIHKECKESDDTDKRGLRVLENAIQKMQQADEHLHNIGDYNAKGIFRQAVIVRNNLAYYLAKKWNYYRDSRDDTQFLSHIMSSEEMSREYSGDKTIACEALIFLKEKRASSAFKEFSANFEDTIAWVDKVFSVNPLIKKQKRMKSFF